MKFLENIPPYLFFTGKGGVGKTSISCATAIRLAEQGKRVLLVSTDPASNVGQVFDQAIGNTIRSVTAVTELSALEIDPQEAAQQYRSRIVDPIKGLLPEDVVNSISEQLSGACTTEIAAFDENSVSLRNPDFPLFGKEISRADFEEKLKENPANDHLKVVVTEKQTPHYTVELTSDAFADPFIIRDNTVPYGEDGQYYDVDGIY